MVADVSQAVTAPQVTFWGAARSVTGSMHYLEANGFRLLLDCGLHRGPRHEARERNSRFPFQPSDLDAVILSHAHIDHCGNLPTLVRQGFTGPIYATPPTQDLLRLMLADSAKIQHEEAVYYSAAAAEAHGAAGPTPLYTLEDADQAMAQCAALPYDVSTEILPGIDLRLVDAGHLLGSAMVALTFRSGTRVRRLTFTGDLGRRGLLLLRDPAPVPAADLVISECTYGGRVHDPVERLSDVLSGRVRETVDRGGKVLIPAFSLGRAQLVAYFLQQNIRLGRIPAVPVYVDSPLAADVADVYRRHSDCFSDAARRESEADPGFLGGTQIRYVRDIDESRAVARRRGPAVIIASGGMCEGGRVLEHMRQTIDDPRCTIILVSYQAPGTLGRKLLERGPTVRFVGRQWNKWADIVELSGFSGHADHADLLASLGPLAGPASRICLVHGEPAQAEALAEALRGRGIAEVSVPDREETVTLD